MDNQNFIKAAGQIWSMLDTLASEKPQEYKEFIDKQLKEGNEHFSSPEQSCFLTCKSAISKDDDKCILHVNVCKWSRIPYPQTDTDPIPVRGGVLRYLLSNEKKKDIHSLVYDIAFNPQVIEECNRDPVMSEMLRNLSLDFVEDMTRMKINREMVTKSNGYVGPVEHIQHSLDESLNHLLPKECMIIDTLLDKLNRLSSLAENDQELPPLKISTTMASTDCRGNLIEVLSSDENNTITVPKHTVTFENKFVLITVLLPNVSSVKDINLEISQEDLELTVDGHYHLLLTFDKLIQEDTFEAKFNRTTNVLSLTANIISH